MRNNVPFFTPPYPLLTPVPTLTNAILHPTTPNLFFHLMPHPIPPTLPAMYSS